LPYHSLSLAKSSSIAFCNMMESMHTRALLAILCFGSASWAASVTPAGIREAATKAVGLIQTSQKDWYNKQSCGSVTNSFCRRWHSATRASTASR
ncbi:MAG: hypothetical protein M3Y27_29470, partial [Acidobacteriota bacterium]|nr:hypothetical protein [Acidobacteriota bacterium]